MSDSHSEIIFRLDLNLRYTYIDPVIEQHSGLTSKDLLGKKVQDFASEIYDADGLKTKCREAIVSRRSVRRDFSVRGKEYRTRLIPELAEDGTVKSLLGITEDVTEEKQTEFALRQTQERYCSLIQSIDGIVWEVDYATWRFTFVSQQAERLLGYPTACWLDQPTFWLDHLHPEDRDRTIEKCVDLSSRNENHELEYRMIHADGQIVWLRDIVTVEQRAGRPFRLRGIMVDITELKREEALRAGENKILEMIAAGAQLSPILNEIILLIESHSPDTRCCVLLLGEDGIHVGATVAPNLPDSYTSGVIGKPIGPYEGSCGAAMYHKKPVIVTDVRIDPVWKNYSGLALAHGVRACWSTPIWSPQGKVLGAFGMHCRECRGPSPAEQRLAEVGTRLAGIAIDRELAEESLRRSEQRYRALVTATAQDVWQSDPNGTSIVVTSTRREKNGKKGSNDGWWSAIHPEDLPHYLEDWRYALNTQEPFESEFRVRTESGPYNTFQSRGVPIKDKDGAIREWIGSNEDITQRKRTEAALRDSEERSRATLRAIPDLMFLLSEDGIYLECHAKSNDQLLFPPDELLGRNMWDILPAKVAQKIQQAFHNASKTDQPQTIEYDLVVHGRLRHTETRVVRSGKDKFLLVVRDVTERKIVELALRESEERFRLVVLATHDAIYDCDLRRRTVWRNEMYRRLYSPDCPIGSDYEWWWNRIEPHDRTRIRREINAAFQDHRQFWSGEYSFRRSNGTYATVMDRGYILYDSNGDAIRVIGAMTDMTMQRESERALRASEERYRNVVETQTEMISRCLPDTTLTFVNDAYCRHFGKTRGELIGKSFLDLIPEAERCDVRTLINGILEGRHSGPSEQKFIAPDGSVRWIQWFKHVLSDGDGGIELQGIGRDITEQKRAEDALRKSQEELRRSHAQIRHLAGCLMKAQEDERRHIARELHDDLNQQIAGLSISLSNIKRQLSPISDFMAHQVGQVQERTSRIANGIRSLSHELHPVTLEHAGLVVALKAMITECSVSQKIKFGLRVPECPIVLPDDVAICLYRVAQESLRNISKHSGARHATVELSLYQDCISLSINDDGCGFEMERERRKGGLGLIGMAERVGLVQGVFELQSRPGDGTAVRATVPLKGDQA
ncbi:MAG TPA: PAS domain S-box protein [Bryobacteraceae bacterium]|nr:PAS domain S-box protein [Bryobacteraceae bacterium]